MAAQPMKNEPWVLAQATISSGMSSSSQGCRRRQTRMATTAAKKSGAEELRAQRQVGGGHDEGPQRHQ